MQRIISRLNKKTGQREGVLVDLTAEEIAAISEEPPIGDILSGTESTAEIARKLEDVLDHLANGAPLTQYAMDWLNERKQKRNK
jgi:hypothetical protein